MIEGTISKNEYLALELVKAWVGQSGTPAKSYEVIDTYKIFLRELEEDN